MGIEYQALTEHIDACGRCSRAAKRVNDFCTTGRMLFKEWIEATGQLPRSVQLLSEEESAKVIAAETEKMRKAGYN